MIQQESRVTVAIRDLPAIVVKLLERAPPQLFSGVHGQLNLFVRYMRSKPGRGLAITYSAGTLNGPRAKRTNISDRLVTVSLPEALPAGTQIRFPARPFQDAALEVPEPGILTTDAGLVVQVFPADHGLPALAASCTPAPGGPVFSALETAARIQLSDSSWHLTSAKAERVRYKPSSRCVLRYTLLLERTTQEGILQHDLTLFGKLYSHPDQARSIQKKTQQLYAEQAQTGQPVIPRPLGIVETLGLSLSEAVQSPKAADRLRTGLRALQPIFERGRGGEIIDMVIPCEELRVTAAGLARLHTSAVLPAGAPRTGAKEAKRVRERAELIAAHNPAQAEDAHRVGNQLARRLETLEPDAYRPAHGGFKASQLLFHSHRVFVVDLDAFCLADPALDVGYFKAYLRPNGLWRHRPGMRQWFEASAASFVNAYREVLHERGIEKTVTYGIVERARFYEAAILFKIATRRVSRLNSPRPGELSSMLTEIVHLMK